MIKTELLITAGVMVAAMTLLMAIVLIFINNRRQDRMSKMESKAELSYMRDYLEKEVLALNNKLLEDKQRWKEVNHLLLSYKPEVNKIYTSEKKIFNNSFFKNFGINLDERRIVKNQVFVLTPFVEYEKDTFNAIQNACQNLGLNCIRGDEEYIKSNIFAFILEKILESRIVIANINGRNPNVFYELGIAQAIGKPTFIVSKNLKGVPFDLQSQNIILYNDLEELQWRIRDMFGRLNIYEG